MTLLVVGLSLYSNNLGGSFHLDDIHWIEENVSIRKGLGNIVDIWKFLPLRSIGNLSFAFNHAFSSQEVYAYHLTNNFIHIVASFFVYLLALLTFKTPKMENHPLGKHSFIIAFMSSLIFLTHPIQTQAVTYIVQRFTSLATLFYVASLVLYIQSRLKNNQVYYWLALPVAIFAMLTKEIAFTLPFVMILYDFTFFGFVKKELKQKFKIFFPFILCLAIIPSLRFAGLQNSSDLDLSNLVKETSAISRSEYLLTQINVIRTYLRLLILPINQNIDYDYPITHKFFEAKTLFSFLLITSIFLWGVKNFKKNRALSFFIFWFFITLSVESSFIPISDVIFEHRLYLPMTGVSILICLLGMSILKKPIKFLIACILIVSTLSILTYKRNEVWANEITLLEDSIKHSPNHPRVVVNLANAYGKSGEILKAAKLLKHAIAITEKDPDTFPSVLPKSLVMLGTCYILSKDYKLAVESIIKGLFLRPDYALGWQQLGLAYVNLDDFKIALDCYRWSEELNPNDPALYMNLYLLYRKMGNPEKAKENYIKMSRLYKVDEESIKDLISNIDFEKNRAKLKIQVRPDSTTQSNY